MKMLFIGVQLQKASRFPALMSRHGTIKRVQKSLKNSQQSLHATQFVIRGIMIKNASVRIKPCDSNSLCFPMYYCFKMLCRGL